MRKATGKVVSLVLALALVVTSFSSIAAFAATKTETGTATVDTNKDLYLANTNGVDNPVEGSKYFNLTDWIFDDNVSLETYDHIVIANDIKISQVTVSGSSIVKVTKVNSDENAYGADKDDYIVSVRDAKGTGTATLNVLLTGKTTERGDDEITVRGSVQIKLTLLDAKTPILTSGVPAFGEEPGSVEGLQKNPTKYDLDHDDDAKTDPVSATLADAYVVKPVANGTAIASYDPQNVVEKNDDNTGYTKDGYVVAATGTRSYVNVDDNKITYGVTEPAVGNTVRLTVYSTKENTEKAIVTDKTVAQSTSKVENKVVGNVSSIDVGDGSKAEVNDKEDTLLSKSKTYAKTGDGYYWDVTGAEVVDKDADLLITAGRLGDVSTSGTVTVNDGTVGTLSTSGTMNLDGGSVSVAKDAAEINVNGAVVGEIKDAGDVVVSSGKVTGAVSATKVELRPLNDEEPVSVGAVKAETLLIDGTDAAAAAASYFATAKDDSSVELIGKNASLGAVDFDYRDGQMLLNGFVGTVPAPTKGTFTGYEETGATITTDSEGETNATISGNLAIANINLESGTVAFTGNVKVDNVGGSEATMVINAGALNITESVATSNTLKIADAADVAAGTVVYTAASEIADESSFVGYGYTVKVVSGTNTDAFVIDSISFSGLTMNKTEAKILLGTSETFTASVYPNGTTMPEGAYIKFFLDGDENYVSGVDNGNGTATITANKYDATFDVLNKATLTAQVYDQYDIQLEEYGEATCAITVIEKPETTYVSDTTGNVNVVAGGTYQFKITSTDGSVPQFAVAGDGSIFKLVAQSNEGNDYFFKVQAVGTVGQVCGVYVNKEATPVATLTVAADYACDTTAVNVAVGATYQVKITANSMPTLAAGNSIYSVAFASQSGNDYFFKITATQNAKAGDVVGFYINGAPSAAFVATTV
mgnify:CR=1 FL=1